MRRIALFCFLLNLAGCSAMDSMNDAVSGIQSYFLGGEDNSEPPAVLVEFTPEIKIEKLWDETVGVGSDEQSLKLIPAIGFGKIVAADRNGLVEARDLSTGRLIWKAEIGVHFSAGPGFGVSTVILGTSDAEVVALNAENGEFLWKSLVSSEVLSVPVIAKGIVVVRTTDGEIVALNEKNGGKLWSYEHNAPALSVRGIGAPIIVEDNVIEGYDNGKLMALRLTNGKYVWETSVA